MKSTKRPWKIIEYTNFNGFFIESEGDPLFGCIAERWENLADDSRRPAMVEKISCGLYPRTIRG